MKKKLMGVLLAVTLLATQAMSVFAAGSIQGSNDVSTDTTGVTVSSSIASTENASVDAAISAVNTSGSLSALEAISSLKDEVSGKKLVSGGFFDVKGTAGQVTLKGLALSGMDRDSIRVLHYSTVRGIWEVLRPDSVDRSAGILTVTFKDLSPVAVIAAEADDSDDDDDDDDAVAATTTAAATPAATAADASGVATSPKTGVVSDWALWMGAAVVLLGIAGFASRKTRA